MGVGGDYAPVGIVCMYACSMYVFVHVRWVFVQLNTEMLIFMRGRTDRREGKSDYVTETVCICAWMYLCVSVYL